MSGSLLVSRLSSLVASTTLSDPLLPVFFQLLFGVCFCHEFVPPSPSDLFWCVFTFPLGPHCCYFVIQEGGDGLFTLVGRPRLHMADLPGCWDSPASPFLRSSSLPPSRIGPEKMVPCMMFSRMKVTAVTVRYNWLRIRPRRGRVELFCCHRLLGFALTGRCLTMAENV